MPPTTRSVTASSSKRTLDEDHPHMAEESGTNSVDGLLQVQVTKENTITIQDLLKRSLKGVNSLEQDNVFLRKKVQALEAKLERVQSADNVLITPKRTKRSAATVSELQRKVKLLNERVRKLEKSKEKYRKRIHELSIREVNSEANELVDDAEFEVGDIGHKMRKLLRSFHDLMVMNSLEGEKEECPICMESLTVYHCQSLPCQHMFCEICIEALKPIPDQDPDNESISCPQCRVVCSRGEVETVEYTASQQWDALLDVARRWAKIDMRREVDTSEEEGEEEFIDDEQNDASTTVSEHPSAPPNPLETSPEPDAQPAEPQTAGRLSRRRVVTDSPLTTPEPEELDIPESNRLQQDGPELKQEEERRSTPPATGEEEELSTSTSSYAQSPTSDKRKRLQDLAEARAKKRRL